MVNIAYTCSVHTRESSSKPKAQTPTQWNLIGRRTTTITAYVIAQQYSSTTFVSSRLHSRKYKFGERFKNTAILIFSLLF